MNHYASISAKFTLKKKVNLGFSQTGSHDLTQFVVKPECNFTTTQGAIQTTIRIHTIQE